MREQDVFVLAEAALVAVVEQIRDDQWTITRTTMPGYPTCGTVAGDRRLRSPGEVAPDASRQDRLLGITGRQPDSR